LLWCGCVPRVILHQVWSMHWGEPRPIPTNPVAGNSLKSGDYAEIVGNSNGSSVHGYDSDILIHKMLRLLAQTPKSLTPTAVLL